MATIEQVVEFKSAQRFGAANLGVTIVERAARSN